MRHMKYWVAALAATVFVTSAHAQTAIKFALDWRWEGPAAPFAVALDRGYFKAEGLDVTIDAGSGSVEGINRVASGTYQMSFADINSLIRFRDKVENAQVKAVMMVYDAPAFAIIALRKSGITKPKDLEGKTLGAPAPDGAYAQWPSFVAANKIDASRVKIENIGFPVREPMLAQGKVDAITGFWFSSFINLKANGVPHDDIVVLLMSEHGLALYGNAIMVNPDFAKSNPNAVRAFLRAFMRGVQDTIRDPESAVKSVLKRSPTLSEASELERLKLALAKNYVTADVRKNGLGAVDDARLARSIDQIAISFKFTRKPLPSDVWTSEFLPPREQRQLPK